MKLSTIGYSIKQGVKNIKRNKLFSLASVGTIAACIFLLGMFYAILANFKHAVDETSKNVYIEVFFDYGSDDATIEKIGNTIKKRVEVDKLVYISPEEAWESFKEDYFKEAPELAEGFADLIVALYGATSGEVDISKIDGVRKVEGSEKVANTVTDFGKIVSYISVAIIVVLLAVGVFLISNTVMIGIAVRKEEIGIMKLMGAKDLFIRAPFIVEGIIIGIVGALIPLTVLFFIYKNVILYLVQQFQSITSASVFLPAHNVFKIMIPMALVIGAGIGFVGSKITIRKHLRV